MTTLSTEDTAELDELFTVLSHPYRRRILTRLGDHDPRDEDEFDHRALAREDDPDLPSIELFHNHLPKLDEAGFIDWERDDGVVRRGPRFGEVAPLIELMVDHRDELPVGWP